MAFYKITGNAKSYERPLIERKIVGTYTNSLANFVGDFAFCVCSSLTAVSFPNAISIGIRAFDECGSLTTALFSNATDIGGLAFNHCMYLTTVSFPKAINIQSQAFYQCSRALTTVYFPSVANIFSEAFRFCHKLREGTFPAVTSIGNGAFTQCSALESLFLPGDTVCILGATAFASTPMVYSSYLGHYGTIYVPSSLINEYKSATNWAVFSNRFSAIEDYVPT